MKIETKKLSKASLVVIVDAARESHVLRESLILSFYLHDLHLQVKKIASKMIKIEKKLQDRRLPVKEHNRLVDQHQRLSARAVRMIKDLDQLETDTGEYVGKRGKATHGNKKDATS